MDWRISLRLTNGAIVTAQPPAVAAGRLQISRGDVGGTPARGWALQSENWP